MVGNRFINGIQNDALSNELERHLDTTDFMGRINKAAKYQKLLQYAQDNEKYYTRSKGSSSEKSSQRNKIVNKSNEPIIEPSIECDSEINVSSGDDQSLVHIS